MVDQVREVTVHGKRGGHAFVYVVDHGYRIEHTDAAGHWGACDLLIYSGTVTEHSVNDGVQRHLRRAGHPFTHPQALAGTHHAGGGEKVNGKFVKGPKR